VDDFEDGFGSEQEAGFTGGTGEGETVELIDYVFTGWAHCPEGWTYEDGKLGDVVVFDGGISMQCR
jgi:hypothetical protein